MKAVSTWTQIKRNRHCYLWIAPFFVLMFVFQLYPMGYGFYLSLTKYGGTTPPEFIGLANYARAFEDRYFWLSLKNMVVLWALIVPARTALALVFAAMLNSDRLLGKRVYMGIVLLPYVTSAVVISLLFKILLATEGGLVNTVLMQLFGIEPIRWLSSVELSKPSVALMNLWRMTGYFSILLLAGMQRIPKSVNEAAVVDGAGSVRIFFRITVPILMPEIFFVFMISTIWVLQNVADVMLLTNGGPLNSSLTAVLYIYQNAFEKANKMGYAAALSFLLFLMILVLSIFMIRRNYKRAEGIE